MVLNISFFRERLRKTTPRKIILRKKRHEPDCSFNNVLDSWLKAERTKVKKSSYSTYLVAVQRHIRPFFGTLSPKDITPQIIHQFIAQKCDPENEHHLAPSTVRVISTVLRSVLQYSNLNGIKTCQAGIVTRPRLSNKKTNVLTSTQFKTFEKWLLNNLDYEKLGILICMYTGLRLGEVCALKWEDISLDNGTLSVNRTIQRIKNPSENTNAKTVLIFDTPKSKNSMRIIPLPAVLTHLLSCFCCGKECFLLTGTTKFIEPRTLQNHFKKMLSRAGIPDTNFHTLRHTFATQCIELGADAKTLSEILGHADVSVTLNTYVHPSLPTMRNLMENFASAGLL